jgi:hypothetical protein
MPEWKDEIRKRLAPARLDPAREAEIVEDLAQHLEDHYEEALAGGSTAEQARRAALGELSDSDALTRGLRQGGRRAPAELPPPGAARGGNVIEDLWQDVRYSVRVMRKNPGFASVAILTLALGIGANTALFSVVNAVLLRPLPYASPEQLIAIQDSLPGVGFPEAGLSEAEFLTLRGETQAFERVACYVDETFTLTGGGDPERVEAGLASADFFPLLRTEMAMGRTFGPEEEAEGQNHVAIVSHGFWQRKFASNPDALGQALTLNGRMYVVIGVLPSGFKSPLELQADARVELWLLADRDAICFEPTVSRAYSTW